jgi:chitin synthase
VSWGTKGDNNAAALGGVTASKGKDGKQVVEVEFPSDQTEINQNYERFIRHLAEPRPDAQMSRDAKTKQEDYFKNFRTRVVLMWMASNAIVVGAVTNETVLQRLQTLFSITPNNAGAGINPFLAVSHLTSSSFTLFYLCLQ